MRAAVIFCILFITWPCWAETYRWVDEKGTIHFTQDYGSVPEKYRDQVQEKPDEPGEKLKTDQKPEKTWGQTPGKGSQKVVKQGIPKKGPEMKDPPKKESKKGGTEKQQVNKNRIESDAADALKTIVMLWKDGKYEALYEYGTDKNKTSTSREKFVQRMKSKNDLASSWETLQDVDAKFKSPSLVYVTARIGHRPKPGGNVQVRTETYEMKLEKGMWKTDLSKILGASQSKQKKGARSH
jgi:hypothetical protein